MKLDTIIKHLGIRDDGERHRAYEDAEDLYKVLLGIETPEATDLATRLEKFIKGSASGIFNQQSNFDIKNKFISGSNEIDFKVDDETQKIQIHSELSENFFFFAFRCSLFEIGTHPKE